MHRYSNLPKLPRFDALTPGDRPSVAPPRVHQVRRRLGAEAVEQLVADYRAGVPTTQLTGKYGIGKGAVLRILDAHGIVRRRQPMSAVEVARAAKLHAEGWSLNAIGRALSRDHTVVRHALFKLRQQDGLV